MYSIYDPDALAIEHPKGREFDKFGLKAFVLYTHIKFKVDDEIGASHAEIYVTSSGWESLTSSGYKSHFFFEEKDSEPLSLEAVFEMFFEASGFDENKDQMSLF